MSWGGEWGGGQIKVERARKKRWRVGLLITKNVNSEPRAIKSSKFNLDHPKMKRTSQIKSKFLLGALEGNQKNNIEVVLIA